MEDKRMCECGNVIYTSEQWCESCLEEERERNKPSQYDVIKKEDSDVEMPF